MSRVSCPACFLALGVLALGVAGRFDRSHDAPKPLGDAAQASAVWAGRGVAPTSEGVPISAPAKPGAFSEALPNEAMAAWHRAMARAPQDESAWQRMLGEIAENNVEAAFCLATELAHERPEVAQLAYAAVLDTLAQRGNYAAAKSVLERIPTGEVKNHLVTNFVLQWGRDDPLAAAAWLLSLPAEFDRATAFAQLGKAWAEIQPQEAAEVLVRLPAGEVRRQALTAALTAWIEANAAAASAWVEQLEPHPDLDLAAARIARVPHLVQTRVEVALSWAESIVDANVRLQALGSILSVWADRDRAATVRYVQNSSTLTPAQRASLLDDLASDAPPLESDELRVSSL